MKTLYEITGKINDINTLLVNKKDYNSLVDAAWQALDTLEHILRCVGFGRATIHWNSSTWEQSDKAADELREALAEQPEVQEPVAWIANDWSVFNTGAEVASGLSLNDAMDYLTDERAARGWSVVCVINKDNMPHPSPPASRQNTTKICWSSCIGSLITNGRRLARSGWRSKGRCASMPARFSRKRTGLEVKYDPRRHPAHGA